MKTSAISIVVCIVGCLIILLMARAEGPVDWSECGTCHSEHARGEYAFEHPDNLSCTACHVTHKSGTGKLLLASPLIVCQEPCHTEMGRSHSVGEALINPSSKMPQDVTCTSDCHDPHGSNYKHILQMPARELCFSCHRL
ncbi:MAG TPA: hypothetical protein ENH10_11000 [Bacteroidetes bacterium]|nr:hypothetical protein [Bacteroidota bacterium]HEX05659.1 hypothetical protein [Bacteroidota bacterium]